MYVIQMNGSIKRLSDSTFIPNTPDNIDYRQCIQDIQTHGLSIICCDSLGYLCDEYDDNTLWQYLDNAVEIITNKYSSDEGAKVKALADLQEFKYVRAIKAKFPYEKKIDAYKIIDATSQDIKDKYKHLPMRR